MDTNIVIFAMNGRKPHIEARIDAEIGAKPPLIIPSVSLFELRYGIAKSARNAQSTATLAQFLLVGFIIADFGPDDAAEAGGIRAGLETKGTPVGPYDVLIAAQARRLGATLVTLNRREFERGPGLSVTDWALSK